MPTGQCYKIFLPQRRHILTSLPKEIIGDRQKNENENEKSRRNLQKDFLFSRWTQLAKLLLRELVVVKIVVRQIDPIVFCCFTPTGLATSSAMRTGLGIGGHILVTGRAGKSAR